MLAAGIKHTALIVTTSNAIGLGLTAAFETHKLTDLVGVGSFVLATASLSHKYGVFTKPVNIRVALINSMVMIWGTRLASHLFSRVLHTHEDKRLSSFFKEKNEGWLDKQKSFYPVKLAGFWLIQTLWGIIVLTPVSLINSVKGNKSMGLLSVLPIVTGFAGIFIESLADHQKNVFRSDSSNDGKVCNIGLYEYVRYPNYLGEMIVWWSIYFASIPLLSPLQSIISIISPSFITYLLLKVSGIPLLEISSKQKYGNGKYAKEYEQYVNEYDEEFSELDKLNWDVEEKSIERATEDGYWLETGTCIIDKPDGVELRFEFSLTDGEPDEILATPYDKNDYEMSNCFPFSF